MIGPHGDPHGCCPLGFVRARVCGRRVSRPRRTSTPSRCPSATVRSGDRDCTAIRFSSVMRDRQTSSTSVPRPPKAVSSRPARASAPLRRGDPGPTVLHWAAEVRSLPRELTCPCPRTAPCCSTSSPPARSARCCARRGRRTRSRPGMRPTSTSTPSSSRSSWPPSSARRSLTSTRSRSRARAPALGDLARARPGRDLLVRARARTAPCSRSRTGASPCSPGAAVLRHRRRRERPRGGRSRVGASRPRAARRAPPDEQGPHALLDPTTTTRGACDRRARVEQIERNYPRAARSAVAGLLAARRPGGGLADPVARPAGHGQDPRRPGARAGLAGVVLGALHHRSRVCCCGARRT